MDEMQIIIMKSKEGHFSEELGRIKLPEKLLDYIEKIQCPEEEDQVAKVIFSTGMQVDEETFYDIYGYYDEEKIMALSYVKSFQEMEESEDPQWEVCLNFEDLHQLEDSLIELVEIHLNEIQEVMDQIEKDRQ